MILMTDREMIRTTAKMFCSNCHDEIEGGACSLCGNPFEHAGRIYCAGNDHYCPDCYDEMDQVGE